MNKQQSVKFYEILVHSQSLHDAIEDAEKKINFTHKLKYIAKNFKATLFEFLEDFYNKNPDQSQVISDLLECYNKFNNLPLLTKVAAVKFGEMFEENKMSHDEEIVVLSAKEYDQLQYPDNKISRILSLLQENVMITYPSGYTFVADLETNYIHLKIHTDRGYLKDGLCILNFEGVKEALKSKNDYENEQNLETVLGGKE